MALFDLSLGVSYAYYSWISSGIRQNKFVSYDNWRCWYLCFAYIIELLYHLLFSWQRVCIRKIIFKVSKNQKYLYLLTKQNFVCRRRNETLVFIHFFILSLVFGQLSLYFILRPLTLAFLILCIYSWIIISSWKSNICIILQLEFFVTYFLLIGFIFSFIHWSYLNWKPMTCRFNETHLGSRWWWKTVLYFFFAFQIASIWDVKWFV